MKEAITGKAEEIKREFEKIPNSRFACEEE